MKFEKLKSIPGKIYMPEEALKKKHECKDCYSCQFCSDERCELCLKKRDRNKK